MSKYSIIGGLLCILGFLLVVFQAISTVTTPGEIVWKSLSIVDVVNAEYVKWIDGISWTGIQKIIKFIATMPLYVLLLCVGGLSFLVGGFVDR